MLEGDNVLLLPCCLYVCVVMPIVYRIVLHVVLLLYCVPYYGCSIVYSCCEYNVLCCVNVHVDITVH